MAFYREQGGQSLSTIELMLNLFTTWTKVHNCHWDPNETIFYTFATLLNKAGHEHKERIWQIIDDIITESGGYMDKDALHEMDHETEVPLFLEVASGTRLKSEHNNM